MVHTQYTRPKCTHHPFTTSGLRTIEIEFQVRHFRRTFFPAFSFIVIPYLYQMYHRENTTELNTDVLIVVGFFFSPKNVPRFSLINFSSHDSSMHFAMVIYFRNSAINIKSYYITSVILFELKLWHRNLASKYQF